MRLLDWPIGKSVGTFSWSEIDVEGSIPLWVAQLLSPEVYKKALWVDKEEQASKQHPSMGSASIPDLTSFSDCDEETQVK